MIPQIKPITYFTDYELNNIRTFNKIKANITNKLNLNIFKISAKKCVVRELTNKEGKSLPIDETIVNKIYRDFDKIQFNVRKEIKLQGEN